MGDSEPIEWTDALLTGVDEIDRQHRILVDIVIDARTSLNHESTAHRFEQITCDLLAYAIYHFDTEERLMEKHGYANAAPEAADKHLTQHRRFSERVVVLRDQVRQGNADARTALLPFLEDWLINHILHTDKRLGEYLRSTT